MREAFADKHILLGVTGGIAAYKAADLASRLVRAGGHVDVILTENAQRFVTPLTFESLTHRTVYTSLWQSHEKHPGHVALAERTDLAVIAPATADCLAKMAHGLADDLLSTVLLALQAPVLVAPAMNRNMWAHPATQANVDVLGQRGVRFVGPEEGRLASGATGPGRMSEPETIAAAAAAILAGA